MSDPNLGRVLAERYRLEELIGRGAMGRVYRAKHVLLDAPVAVKFLSQTLLNKKMRDRFKREARSCFLLGQKSKHIVQVLDYGVSEDEVPFYVMEYLEGRDLGAIVKRETIPLPRFLNLAHQICLGLQAAHQGILLEDKLCPIIHRDIKPSNLLVVQDPDMGESVKILDFGIAKLIQDDAAQTSHFMGTLAYSSPEQMEGKELDGRADIYSLGVVMFEMLAGKMPLRAETHSFGSWYKVHRDQSPLTFAEVRPDLKVPKILESLVLQCLSKNPGDRPSSVGEILQALEPMEHRYSPGRTIGRRIESTLQRATLPGSSGNGEGTPVRGRSSSSDPDVICRLQSWPKGKPVAEIVFPHLLPTSGDPLVTVWIMLPRATIQSIQASDEGSSCYSRFMGMMSPHPMVLWLTVLYISVAGTGRRPKWLPSYLDLKQSRNLETARHLAQQGCYRLLFFALEDPQNCQYVAKIHLTAANCQMLRQWADQSVQMPATQPGLGKDYLRKELERAKPQILQQIEQRLRR
ncbi:MAG: serine/threonine protein kinase [Oscillatoriales cyanobacterium]|nr:MAG: serine/threonine protein kinase [Oscillatoriales cyanobacterium]